MPMRSFIAIALFCCSFTSLLAASLLAGDAANSAANSAAELRAFDQSFTARVQPLLKTYCFKCHSGDTTEAEIDLAAFKSVADMRTELKTLQKMRHILETNQMPPKEAKQPGDAEKEILTTWVRSFLSHEARANAGDPGPVVLRRLNNAEYTYTLQDLTGIDTLDPAKEFPVDGAAGEGFINSGAAQTMSPALFTKYLDAAKQISRHAVLVPDGIRFSRHTTRRDKTNELLARIQSFYSQFCDDGAGAMVDLQGIKFTTNKGGLLPVERYLAALVQERDALLSEETSVESVARAHNLNARYLTTLFEAFSTSNAEPSYLLDSIRARWRTANKEDVAALSREIAETQKVLWKFNSVGQIGRQGGPKSWLEPVSPVATRRDLRLKLPPNSDGSDIVIYLTANDLGDGNQHDFVVYQQPRIEFDPATKVPPVMLRDVKALTGQFQETIQRELGNTAKYLAAVRKLGMAPTLTIEQIAAGEKLNLDLFESWIALADLKTRTDRKIRGHFTTKLTNVQGYKTINGWGSLQTPSLMTNASTDDIGFLTLTVPARGVTVHPSPTLESIVAWRSPVNGGIQINGLVADADNKCGNGAEWRIELLGEFGITKIGGGTIENGARKEFKPTAKFEVRQGDVLSLVVGPRDGGHACDTTHVELAIATIGKDQKVWSLTKDIVDNVLASNPLPDSYGNSDVWHFCVSESKPGSKSTITGGTSVAVWRNAVFAGKPVNELEALEQAIQLILSSDDNAPSEPDRKLREQLTDWRGPLDWLKTLRKDNKAVVSKYGLVGAEFGRHPNGASNSSPIGEADCCLRAPHSLEIRLPAKLFAGAEFVTTADLQSGKQGSVQVQLSTAKPTANALSLNAPVLVSTESQSKVEAAVKQYRDLFPPALCYHRIVPVDEVVTLTLFHREDDQLQRLMLNEEQRSELGRLWEELLYVSQEPLKLTVAFEQLAEFATQDRPDLVKQLEPLRKPINDRADAFLERLIATQPRHLEAVVKFAARSWRRDITQAEREKIESLYRSLRDNALPHDEAIRLTLARVLTSPAFLYRLEQPAEAQATGTQTTENQTTENQTTENQATGTQTTEAQQAGPVTNVELANRLSFFLWSSLPDRQLMDIARSGTLTKEDILHEQTMRMLAHPRARRMAIHFACQWLHIRDFDQNDDKNEQLYPEFANLKSDMYEETVLFFEDLFRHDGSILDILNSDHTFVNEALAKHYGLANSATSGWSRVDGMRAQGRGGILTMATILASQSGASRTSPILRGNWVSETLLGERLPRPPANVPQLPETVPKGLTARQLIEQHTSVAECAKCHARIDPYGFALEQYDALGRIRPTKADTSTKLFDGKQISGVDGLRNYLVGERRDDFVRQFCRKLLGYSLGRSVQLSDEPLLDTMQQALGENDFRFSVAVNTIVRSKQFRNIRGNQN